MVGVLLFLPFFASDGEWRPRREVTATFVGLRSVRETLIQFVSQIFENNDLAFFEAAIDTPPILFNYFQSRIARLIIEMRLQIEELVELLRERPAAPPHPELAPVTAPATPLPAVTTAGAN